jgi:hypothetical protein
MACILNGLLLVVMLSVVSMLVGCVFVLLLPFIVLVVCVWYLFISIFVTLMLGHVLRHPSRHVCTRVQNRCLAICRAFFY